MLTCLRACMPSMFIVLKCFTAYVLAYLVCLFLLSVICSMFLYLNFKILLSKNSYMLIHWTYFLFTFWYQLKNSYILFYKVHNNKIMLPVFGSNTIISQVMYIHPLKFFVGLIVCFTHWQASYCSYFFCYQHRKILRQINVAHLHLPAQSQKYCSIRLLFQCCCVGFEQLSSHWWATF